VASTVETELFPVGALQYYTKKNMGWEYTQDEYTMWQLPERGGEQGDYRDGMIEKINNVIDCLRCEPLSKRAIIPIPFATEPSSTVTWKNQGQNKCCRELHFYLEDGKLKCTGIVRMQNANIFVKNIHFFSTLIFYVAKELGNIPVGEYTHWITNVCHDRSATGC
jgi:thymidylate synthase